MVMVAVMKPIVFRLARFLLLVVLFVLSALFLLILLVIEGIGWCVGQLNLGNRLAGDSRNNAD